MKKLLLASASALLITGVAMAQSSTPAPTSTPPSTAPMVKPMTKPTASSAANPMTSANAGTPTTTTPMNSTSTNPSTEPMHKPPAKPMDNTMGKSKAKPMGKPMDHPQAKPMMHRGGAMEHHAASREMMMPTSASAHTYLQIASKAITAHNKMRAHEALGRAETDMLTNSYVQGSINGRIATPAITNIEQARQAVMAGHFHDAMMMTHKAMMMDHGSMMHHTMNHTPQAQGRMMSHAPMTPNGMAPNPMNHGPMGQSPMGQGGMSQGNNGTTPMSQGRSNGPQPSQPAMSK